VFGVAFGIFGRNYTVARHLKQAVAKICVAPIDNFRFAKKKGRDKLGLSPTGRYESGIDIASMTLI